MTRRDRLALTVIVVFAAVAAFWFLGLGSKRKDADKLAVQVTAQETRRDQARTNLAAYQAARGSYRANYAAVARLGKAVPADDDVPSLLYQVQSTAEASGIDFQALQVGTSGTPTPPAPASTASSDADAASGTTVGAASFQTVPFSFTFEGSFFKLSKFFERLQNYIRSTNQRVTVSGRLMALNGIDLAAGPKGFPQITAKAEAVTYLVPADQGLFNGADSAAPSTATQPAGSGGGGSSSPTPAAATVVAPK